MMKMLSGGGGSPAGFLGRVTTLEREVSFLKQKVEDDARWKHLLEKWIIDNFAFDVRGALLTKDGRGGETTNENKTSSTNTKSSSHSKQERSCRKRLASNKAKKYVEMSEDEFLDNENANNFVDNEPCDDDEDNESQNDYERGDTEMEVSVDPRDLIITPDLCSESSSNSLRKKDRFEDSVGCRTTASTDSEYQLDDEGEVENSSSDENEEHKPKTYRKMDWTLKGTYPNLETLKKNFNIREWALSTTARSGGRTKIYYYCKECRKHGPGRLQLRYDNPDSEVEIYQNTLSHDHSGKVHLSEEMKEEILNLYKAGMKSSTQIINAVKISKPDLRLPSSKQVCYTLKSFRMTERKVKQKQAKQSAKVKSKKIKKVKKLEETATPQVQVSSNNNISSTVQMQQPTSLAVSAGACGQFQGPHIVSVSGFSPSLQQFTYHQPISQPSGGFDHNTTTLQLHPQHFHTL